MERSAEALVTGVSALLLISPNAADLASFHRGVLDLPLAEEVHEGVLLHYACDLGGVHFAIHPSKEGRMVDSRGVVQEVLSLIWSDDVE